MKYSKTTKPRHRFKAIKWTKLEKPRHTIIMKWTDLNTTPHYVQGKWYGKGYTDNGGKSRKCRYA
jgi:hypothetical protein